ncbi:DUF1997 domain-containing protein [Geminocystis sp. NIES-3709]|uniref:DUF1997 domain-containing protein n=1 Tax=Geminocystis sp. NIES-3709 TaxID=1617448 RepID=UPI0005FC8513|nr:DUF1997 domain-containing protein [Geminocystis sp. NIES-3709]BAQ63313.1 hypothetical protein GM3709_78 [Geminocystis sp. NIES-3709]
MTDSNIPSKEETLRNNPITESELEISSQDPVVFQTHFGGIMEMYSDLDTVANYLNDHQGWFVRCAMPMKAEPFGENGYTLIIGCYGAFGYNVEPQMTVILEPPQANFYYMYSVPNPEFSHEGYEVDYHSKMYIESIPFPSASKGIIEVYNKQKQQTPSEITKVNWQLNLQVKVRFPRFIYKLPLSLLQDTGDRLLSQIVKQVSPRLSYKVQKDFHSRFNLPIPPKTSRTCHQIANND